MRVGFSSVFNANDDGLLRGISFREDDFRRVVVQVFNVGRQRALIIANHRASVSNSQDLSELRPLVHVGLK